jgi:ABC-type transport system substrate-binding protein
MFAQKKLFVIALVLIMCVWTLINFASPASAQTKQIITINPPLPSTDYPPPSKAVRGGILKMIRPTFPKNVGYPPEWAPIDSIYALPVCERLIDWDEKGNVIPWLARSWELDLRNNTVTFHLRKGVQYTDGTPFNAEAARWNFQLRLDTKSQLDGDLIKSVEALDEYTLRLNCTSITSWSPYIYGWPQNISPTAYQKNGGKEWARFNSVGTGPFKVVEYKRDNLYKLEKNPNYWRKGYPLLDGIEVRWVPDPVTASMMMVTKDADCWMDIQNVTQIVDLEKRGFKINWGPGMFWALLPANAKDPNSPYTKKKVREALEYAIDRPAIAKSIGMGKFEPMVQVVPSASQAFNKGYNPRPYNPEKAKQLLAEAGYPNGLETKLLAMDTQKDAAVALKGYMDAAGFNVNIDICDMGRYFAAVFSPAGWTDLVLAASGINPDATDLFVHFGPRPWTYRFGFIAKTPEFLASCEKALQTYDPAGFKIALQAAVKQASEDAMITPLWRSAQAGVLQSWTYTDYVKIHTVVWYSHQDWMETRK